MARSRCITLETAQLPLIRGCARREAPEGNITRRVPKKAAAHSAPEANQKLRPLEGGVTKKIGTTEARQGETPHIVRYMLGISLVAAIVALAIVGVVLIR
jgi:hypothetical protein